MRRPVSYFLGLIAIFCVLPACEYGPPKADKELFLNFYKDIIERMDTFDQQYEPFSRALKSGNILKVIATASEIEKDVSQCWSRIQELDVPPLKNEAARGELKRAKDLVSSSYYNRDQTLLNVMEYSKTPSLYSLAKLRTDAEKSQAQFFLGVATLATVANRLNVTTDDMAAVRLFQGARK